MNTKILAILGVVSVLLIGCREQTLEQYPALDGSFQSKWRFSSAVTTISANCSAGERGSIFVTNDNRLLLVYQGMSYPRLIAPLQSDGSAKVTVGGYEHSNRLVKVTVAAGNTPRIVTSLDEQSLCGYRFDPD